MRWRIKDFIFCEREQTLTSDQGVQQLEPMVVELLAYFCKHNNQIISRDQLIEQVWLGRMITDNAVSKVITKLRKVFKDDAKKPQFIATFPKKGYKFIAEVSQIVEEPATSQKVSVEEILVKQGDDSTQSASTDRNKTFISPLVVVISIAVLIGITIILQLNNKQHQPITQVKAITREPGRESSPTISPNGKYLAYVEVRDKKMHQWIKSLADETAIEISHGDQSNYWVSSASWNSDGSAIVYLVTTPSSCQYYVRQFKEMSLGEPELIHNCTSGSAGKIAFTHDDNRLVYTESGGRNLPYELFELRLDTGVKRRLKQPELFLLGNLQFDLHPTENKLLISSVDKQQWERFYSLDLETGELILLFKQDAFICCGIWDHTGTRVVLMGEHPSTQLVSYNLQGEDKQIVYSGSEQVRLPERHINGKDYLFSIAQINQNASYFNLTDSIHETVANTSVDDKLATFAQHNNQVAFIGLSSGNEEVWLTDLEGKMRKKLTSFDDGRHYFELVWSYNGNYLIGLTINEIHLIHLSTGRSEVLKIPQVEIRGVSWKSQDIISFSTKSDAGWSVNYYDIRTHEVTQETGSWEFIQYSYNPDDTLWFDSTGLIYFGLGKIAVQDNELLETDYLNGRTFNLKKSASRWAWQERINGKYRLMVKDSLSQKATARLNTDSHHFDLSQNGLLYHTFESLDADIYRTVRD